MTIQAGGCLCGAVRYETRTEPVHVTLCHCRFCQRATGAAYMVEPIFRRQDLRLTQGQPAVYQHRSEGSGQRVWVHFCAACGTKLYLTFERFEASCGVYAGTFDDPNWFTAGPGNAKHIFIGVARHDTVLLPGIPAYEQHAMLNDGTPLPAVVFDQPRLVGRPGGEE